MRIIGHGIDLVDVERIDRSLTEYADRFRDRVFTKLESDYCGDSRRPGPHFAARFAAKEAVLKAIGTGWRSGIAWTDIEVVNGPSGAPTIRLSGQASLIAQSLGITSWHISLTHTGTTAMASAIAVGD